MNVVKDVIFEGRILDQVIKAVDYIKTQMKERTYLAHGGRFVTEEEYGEFVRTEIIVNAVTHRDYGIKGTDIQIKMFDNRLEVDSPGTFAGMVRKDNIRYTHFSRNPKIAAFLKDYDYVKEFGEGVDRMCNELETIGLPDPTFDNSTFILKTTIMSSSYEKLADSNENLPIGSQKLADSSENLPIKVSRYYCEQEFIKHGYNSVTINKLLSIYDQIDTNQVFNSSYIMKLLECSERTARNIIAKLKESETVESVSASKKGQYRFKLEN